MEYVDRILVDKKGCQKNNVCDFVWYYFTEMIFIALSPCLDEMMEKLHDMGTYWRLCLSFKNL